MAHLKASPHKIKLVCQESELKRLAKKLAPFLQISHQVLLEGSLGSGKTTFARALLKALEINQPPEGSPTFAIAHEYTAPIGKVVHLDFYRIQSVLEMEERGIPSYYWEMPCLVISEWLSLWPELENQIFALKQFWRIHLSFTQKINSRIIEIQSHFTSSLLDLAATFSHSRI